MKNKRRRLRAKVKDAQLRHASPTTQLLIIILKHRSHYGKVERVINTPENLHSIIMLPLQQRTRVMVQLLPDETVEEINDWTKKIDQLIKDNKF